jgi:hypothetical protein
VACREQRHLDFQVLRIAIHTKVHLHDATVSCGQCSAFSYT